jgi:hypothetical protein
VRRDPQPSALRLKNSQANRNAAPCNDYTQGREGAASFAANR